ncbi:hypothetical protein ES703_79753 [subsurface metagenome]
MPLWNPYAGTAAIAAHAAIPNAHHIPRKILAGSYAGDDADARQITVGFKCSLVILLYSLAGWSAIPNITLLHFRESPYHSKQTSYVSLHASDGFVVTHSGAEKSPNASGSTYYYWAVEE